MRLLKHKNFSTNVPTRDQIIFCKKKTAQSWFFRKRTFFIPRRIRWRTVKETPRMQLHSTIRTTSLLLWALLLCMSGCSGVRPLPVKIKMNGCFLCEPRSPKTCVTNEFYAGFHYRETLDRSTPNRYGGCSFEHAGQRATFPLHGIFALTKTVMQMSN